jgi:hypothetical protein
LKWSAPTCAAAAPSWNASTTTNWFGSVTLRLHSKKMLPGSARVASVKPETRSSHWSACSGLIVNLTTMKIMEGLRSVVLAQHHQ